MILMLESCTVCIVSIVQYLKLNFPKQISGDRNASLSQTKEKGSRNQLDPQAEIIQNIWAGVWSSR